MLRIHIAALALLPLFGTAASAQSTPPHGEHVRIAWSGSAHGIEGTLSWATPDSVWIMRDGARGDTAIALRNVTAIDVRRQAPRLRTIFKSVAIGGVFGSLAGALAAPILSSDCLGFFADMTDGSVGCIEAIADGDRWRRGALVGAAAGSAIGLLAGIRSSRARWEGMPIVETPSGVRVAWSPSGTSVFSMNVTLPIPPLQR